MKTNLNKTEKSTKKRTYYVIQCTKKVNGKPAHCGQIQIYTNLKDAEDALWELSRDWKEEMNELDFTIEDSKHFIIRYKYTPNEIISRYYVIRKWTNDREIDKFHWKVETLR